MFIYTIEVYNNIIVVVIIYLCAVCLCMARSYIGNNILAVVCKLHISDGAYNIVIITMPIHLLSLRKFASRLPARESDKLRAPKHW
jgi:hypothetical protein